MSCLSGLAEAFQHRTRPAAVGLLTVHRTAYTPQIAGPSTPCGCSFRSPPARRPAVGLGVHSRASRGQVQAVCAIKKGSEKNVVCSKTLVIKPGQEKRVLPRCRDIVDFTRGRMASRGSGVLAFECMQDRYEKNVLHFWERYDSNANMGKHNNTPELQAFMREVSDLVCYTFLLLAIFVVALLVQHPCLTCLTDKAENHAQVSTYLEGPIGMALYEWKDGKIGQQCIQGGEQEPDTALKSLE